MLLEAIADALLGGHPLEDAAVQAARLLGRERLGGEVVDTGGEAVLNETAKGLNNVAKLGTLIEVEIKKRRRDFLATYAHELLDLALLHALL